VLLGWDRRIIQYLKILLHERKKHVVIESAEGNVKNMDIISEVERLLQNRYFLAERVYYYHTKLAADAMIAKAISEAGVPKDLETKTDDEILLDLQKSKNQVSKKLSTLLWERKLHRTSYMIDRSSIEKNKSGEVERNIEEYRKKTGEFEEMLLKKANAQSGDVIVFSLPSKMNMKVADALIRRKEHSDIDIVRAKTLAGFNDICEKHKRMWRLYVFTVAGIEDTIAKKCEELFGLKNLWDIRSRKAR